MKRFKAAFVYLSRDDQDLLLHALAYPRNASNWTGEADANPDKGHAHFEALKGRVMTAYYSSQLARKNWAGTARLRTAPIKVVNIRRGITSDRD